MSESTAEFLSALTPNQLKGTFQVPEGFPDIRFDYVTQEDLRERLRVEASAPGLWQLSNGMGLMDVQLNADVHQYSPN